MANPRSRLVVETLEAREVPTVLFTETFDTVAAPGLPAGWGAWSSDHLPAYTTAPHIGIDNTGGLVSEANSRTAAMTWYPEIVSGDTGAAVTLRADSLVPIYVFARGNDLETGPRSFLAAVVTRGLKVQLIETTGAFTRVLRTVTSPSSAHFSNGWVRVALMPQGPTAKVEVTRLDTGAYLNASGTWQTAPTHVLSATTTLNPTTGRIGIGRQGLYFGTVALDNFSVLGSDVAPAPPPVVTPPPPAPPLVVTPPVLSPPPVVTPPPSPAGTTDHVMQSFDTTAIGSAPAGWNGWGNASTGWFAVTDARALSPTNGFASNGTSASSARAWATTDLPANVDVSVAVYLDSLIAVHVFARGNNLQSATPTYYAISLTRGLEARLIKVVGGAETTLGTIRSTAYLSNQWVRARLIADGDRLAVQLYRLDTRQWLTRDGLWSDTPDFALEKQDASISSSGKAGIARVASVAGTVVVDDFQAKPVGVASGPQISITRNGTGNVTGETTFRATVTGSFNRIEFRLNNVVRAISATSPAEWTFDSTTVVNGSYTLTVRAFDLAGNVTSEDLEFTVSNRNRDPLPVPTIPRHYSHIRIAQLAYAGTPINNPFEQNLLRNSVDLVIANPAFLSTIEAVAPDTPQLIYSNVSNLYQGLLTDWLGYADRTGASREAAFFHVTKPTPFQGASPSSQPVTWFWSVYQAVNEAPPIDVTSAARGGRNFNVQFGGAGTSTAIGFVEKFREMNITLARTATTGWSGVWEYVSATDATGNPTTWKTLSLLQDGTGEFRTSGRVTFDPPKDWVPSAAVGGRAHFYHVRFRVTTGTTASGPVLLTVFGRDYVNAAGGMTGVIPAFDYAADTDADGYLNDAEYANRQAGLDARFVYESRLFYPYYGQMRYVTNPAATAVRHWAADYHQRLLAANPLADGIFMDNATGKLPFAAISVLEPTATYSDDSGALMGTVSRTIAPKWVLANTAGANSEADPVVANSVAAIEEFLLRPLAHNWSEVGDVANLVARRLNTPGTPYLVLDSRAEGGAALDARTQMATLAYYYLLADAERTFLMFYGGDSPSTSWTLHWSPAAAVNVGTPVTTMSVFASGTDPANPALTYRVFAREYTNAWVLYKPLSYAQGKGEGTTADATATTHQLGSTYQIVNSNGTLGPLVTSVTLRNGQGVILMKV